MKSKIVVMTLVLMLIGVNLYAAGDLVVNGRLGVGASTPSAKVDIDQTTTTGGTSAFKSNLNKSSTNFINANLFQAADSSVGSQGFAGMNVWASHTGSGNSDGKGMVGASYTFLLMGSASALENLRAQQNQLWIRGSGNYNVVNTDQVLAYLTIGQGAGSGATHTLTTYSGVRSGAGYIADTVNGTNWAHFRAGDFTGLSGHGTVTNVSGLWIDNQTFGTNRYGIVLNGDGAGSDIVFGPSQGAKIYSSSGRLYAQDSFGNQTILSPHDPQTGEWIYYSKNVKTGKVVRVDMEKLVKAVEKMTGEKFMVETLIDAK